MFRSKDTGIELGETKDTMSYDTTSRSGILGSDKENPLSSREDVNRLTGPTPPNPWHPSQFPEGGLQAWLVVLGAFCCVFCSFGWINCKITMSNCISERPTD